MEMVDRVKALNEMSQEAFVEALEGVFEETPTIAAQAWDKRPFCDGEHLFEVLVAQMWAMSAEEQLALIRRHPDLGSRVRMGVCSVAEQASAGLDRLTPQEFDRFLGLNQAYQERFGFPFIMAVKDQTKETILGAFAARLYSSVSVEHQKALEEITKIVRFRLRDRHLI